MHLLWWGWRRKRVLAIDADIVMVGVHTLMGMMPTSMVVFMDGMRIVVMTIAARQVQFAEHSQQCVPF